jgi:4-hydroxy-2-oxoheptanedioate aldolase
METRLARVWREGGVAVNGWLSIPSPVTAELVARQGYDTITVDLQHGLIDYQVALSMMQAVAAAGDATIIARPPWNEPGIIMKLLDAGAWGILCPMVNNRQDAENLVGACH